MKKTLLLACLLWLSIVTLWAENQPLRVFIRAGEKTHGPGQHDHPRFLEEWKGLLNQRGAQADGAMTFPTAAQLKNTDVLMMYCAEGGSVSPEDQSALHNFLNRGGGLVVIHDAVCGTNAPWFKTVIGGAWEHGHSKWFEGNIALYYQDFNHPITQGAANFDLDDEMYYDLHLQPEARILAATYKPDERNQKEGRMFPSVYDIVPQMWVYEKDNYRAFVSIPGHNHKTFDLPHYRAILLRGLAWAGKREANLLCSQEELASLLYPAGGPTAPEKAAAKITVPPEFNLNLVAAEPLVEKPISLDWDVQGRLWVAETPEYPTGKAQPNGEKANRPGRDRISILEDTNADGLMDKKTVFSDGLELITSFVFYRDGVIVGQAPDIYWLRDTDGDGKSDKKETLYTGFGTRDTHAVISNFRWGQDGWIYATLGYSGGEIQSGDGKKALGSVSSAVIRFKPDGSALEQFSSKNSNTWGLDFTSDNELFFSQANGDHCNHVVLPETALARGRAAGTTSFKTVEDHKKTFPIRRYDQQAYVQVDHVGGFTAASGATIYHGGAWPAEWEGNFFVSEPTVNLVHRDLLQEDGISYVARKDQEAEFIASTDLWFRPVHARVGPDGALYILDFYNQAAVHNDTRGPKHGPNNAAVRPDRDHFYGRIWRVQHKEAKKYEVLHLAQTSGDELVRALQHPNEWVRMTAHRQIVERGQKDIFPALAALAVNASAPAAARIHALWVLQNLGDFSNDTLVTALSAPETSVVKNALRIIGQRSHLDPAIPLHFAVIQHFQSKHLRIQLEAILAENAFKPNKAAQDMLINVYPKFPNTWLQSAVLGIASKSPNDYLESALSVEAAGLETFTEQLSSLIVEKQDPGAIADIMVRLATTPPRSDPLKKIVLEKMNEGLKPDFMLPWTPPLQRFMEILLNAQYPGLAMATLPLVVRWDRNGFMATNVKEFADFLVAHLNDGDHPEPEQLEMAKSMLGAKQVNEQIIPEIAKIIGSTNSAGLQKQIVEVLGKVAEPAVVVEFMAAYPKASGEVQGAILQQLLKRSEWSLTLLDMLATKKFDLSTLDPLAINRLRTHADKNVAARAQQVLDELRGPQIKEKDALIAKFAPVMDEYGNPEFGKQLFDQNCAVCHRFNGNGKEVGPDLTGIGAHGPRELLVHVLDPNRVVEHNFLATSIETKDGESYEGIIAREDKNTVVLRHAAGETEIKKDNIKNRKATGRSLMPEGFESMGPGAIRDILDYMCSAEGKYRVLDLKTACTASTLRGLFQSQDKLEETLKFKKFGMVKVGEIPFEIINPSSTSSGHNVIVLKGGTGFAQTLPTKVVVTNLNLKAFKLHILGGVAGWGFPWGDKTKMDKLPVMKASVTYTNGRTEEFTLRNGVEFADYSGNFDVPGSQAAPGLVSRGQVRAFALQLGDSQTPVQKLTLESFNNEIAPVLVAITAEIQPKKRVVETMEDLASFFPHSFGPIAVSMLGGGSHHDFKKYFNEMDSVTMVYASDLPVNYTEQLDYFQNSLTNHDVLYICSNQPMTNDAVNKGIFAFANRGKGLLLVHPALWYNWKNWPEYNRELVGGGTTSHDKYGPVEVTITQRRHPIMENIPKSFTVQDELYHFKPDPAGTPIEVLATGKNPATGVTYPVVWITQHPKAKIVCITLGHDADTHNNIAYRVMLQNAMAWVAGRKSGETPAETKSTEAKTPTPPKK